MEEDLTLRGFGISVMKCLWDIYHYPLHQHLAANPELVRSFTGFLLNPEKVVLHMGRTHIGLEYYGPERVEKIKSSGILNIEILDYSQSSDDFVERVIGFQYGRGIRLPAPYTENLVLPTDAGFDKLTELGWNFAAQDMILPIGSGAPSLAEGQFSRWINAFFFDADKSGLKTRHIKWIDFIPLDYDDKSDPLTDSFNIDARIYNKLWLADATYRYPLPPRSDYKFNKLPIINRFIELSGQGTTSEPEITAFLSKPEHEFIITMKFGALGVASQLKCEWQSDPARASIQPDFFVLDSNGYADILEFKLPSLKSSAVVGSQNRETFSAELHSYISQTRVYSEYFDDPNNRKWFESKYGFKVHRPRRILVAGRRADFTADVWREIADDFKNITLLTYDDLVDGVTAQFYK